MFQCFVGLFVDYERNYFMSVEMKIVDILWYEYFDNQEYFENSFYFMYGDKENVFLFYVFLRSFDFFQVIIYNVFKIINDMLFYKVLYFRFLFRIKYVSS